MKKNALGFFLAFLSAASAVLTAPEINAAPSPATNATLRFLWDYNPTSPPANFLLLWNTNAVFAGTNLFADVFIATPGLYSFTASATNRGGATNSAPLAVRVVRMHFEGAPTPAGPWVSDTNFYHAWSTGTNSRFYRARLEW